VPTPASMILLGSGLLALMGLALEAFNLAKLLVQPLRPQ
jgi:hypothetical protein